MIRALILAAGVGALAAPALAAEPNERGKVVYDHWCAACHNPGPFKPGTNSLAVKYKGERPDDLEKRTDLTPDLVKFYVRNGVLIMPPFRKTEVSDADLAALGAYLSGPKK